jgi:hypothetical protein
VNKANGKSLAFFSCFSFFVLMPMLTAYQVFFYSLVMFDGASAGFEESIKLFRRFLALQYKFS